MVGHVYEVWMLTYQSDSSNVEYVDSIHNNLEAANKVLATRVGERKVVKALIEIKKIG